jgi:hypothetical protein
MTGEADNMKKESIDNCIKMMEQHEMEKRATKSGGKADPHEIPSAVMLSGTSIAEGDG